MANRLASNDIFDEKNAIEQLTLVQMFRWRDGLMKGQMDRQLFRQQYTLKWGDL